MKTIRLHGLKVDITTFMSPSTLYAEVLKCQVRDLAITILVFFKLEVADRQRWTRGLNWRGFLNRYCWKIQVFKKKRTLILSSESRSFKPLGLTEISKLKTNNSLFLLFIHITFDHLNYRNDSFTKKKFCDWFLAHLRISLAKECRHNQQEFINTWNKLSEIWVAPKIRPKLIWNNELGWLDSSGGHVIIMFMLKVMSSTKENSTSSPHLH